jgi:hypothetical protein
MADVFTMLRNDHRHVEDLARVGESEDGAERRVMIEELTRALALHMRFEEQQLYPLLADLDTEMAEEAEIEHGLARESLSKLGEPAAAPGFGAAVDTLTGGIGHHMKDEETELFPRLRLAFDRGTGRVPRGDAQAPSGRRRPADVRSAHRDQGRAARARPRRWDRRPFAHDQGAAPTRDVVGLSVLTMTRRTP